MRRTRLAPATLAVAACLVVLGAAPASSASVDRGLQDMLVERTIRRSPTTDGTYTWSEFARSGAARGSTTQAVCQFNNVLDSIHYSSTPPATLSVHGS